MTKTQFRKEIIALGALMQESVRLFDQLSSVSGCVANSPLLENNYKLTVLAIKHLSARVEDREEWIDYYFFDRPKRGGCMVSIRGKEYPCNTPGQLWEIIQVRKES